MMRVEKRFRLEYLLRLFVVAVTCWGWWQGSDWNTCCTCLWLWGMLWLQPLAENGLLQCLLNRIAFSVAVWQWTNSVTGSLLLFTRHAGRVEGRVYLSCAVGVETDSCHFVTVFVTSANAWPSTTHIYARACMHAHTRLCMHAHANTCTSTHTRARTHTHTQSELVNSSCCMSTF